MTENQQKLNKKRKKSQLEEPQEPHTESIIKKKKKIKKIQDQEVNLTENGNSNPEIINDENIHQFLGQDDEEEKTQMNLKFNKEFFSNDKFSDIEICEPTKMALKNMKMKYMTHIQSRTIPHSLKGRDVLGAAKTGSGKTLAFLIPALELLHKAHFQQKNGTGIIIITPTRELALTIFDVAKELCEYHSKTVGLLIGGTNRKNEAIKLKMGVNIIIATPGRLLDHLQNTKNFVFHSLQGLIIDEADCILKQGFEEEMTQILQILPSERQTMLFSATQTKKIEDLVRLSMKNPIYIGVDDGREFATVEGLEQGFVLIEADAKFLLLFTFLQKNKKKKMMVFFSSCNSVKFHSELLNYVDVPVLSIHGKQKQSKRLNTFYEFSNAEAGILLCTDVAARGLDIPSVDWIVQYDPPDDTKEYIHRVGRTCRGANGTGKALLFLLPEEKGYLNHLKQARVPLNEYEFPKSKLSNIQDQFDKLIERNYYLNRSAFDGYRSYLHSYMSHSLKQTFNIHNLDLQKIARSFGFKVPPRVNLNVKISGKTIRKNKLQNFGSSQYNKLAYKEDKDKSLLQKNKQNDNRQFSR